MAYAQEDVYVRVAKVTGQDVTQTRNQIRHLVHKGIVPITDKRGSGRGTRRSYDLLSVCVAAALHLTNTQGCGLGPGTVNGQPLTVCWSVARSTGLPPALTLELLVESDTVPAWGQSTVEAVVSIGMVIA